MPRHNHPKKRTYKKRKKVQAQPVNRLTAITHNPHKIINKDKPCPRCGHYVSLEGGGGLDKHHILPRRWFKENGNHLWVCYDCHHLILEPLIERVELRIGGGRIIQLASWEYFQIVAIFLRYKEAGVDELLKHCLITLKK